MAAVRLRSGHHLLVGGAERIRGTNGAAPGHLVNGGGRCPAPVAVAHCRAAHLPPHLTDMTYGPHASEQ
ncbi:hypothetical protein OsI_37282 [Oryza sativa Indica Group]|uniref:Uncharacterized protein n=1 Tax=Oryza sativa subsp. indica TaxID=39946 RepID=B8BP04_ORYSI|nr:hypothetical protein OsI_37282 [Oryza sativa Indica Group]